jgi:hypothetical protein
VAFPSAERVLAGEAGSRLPLRHAHNHELRPSRSSRCCIGFYADRAKRTSVSEGRIRTDASRRQCRPLRPLPKRVAIRRRARHPCSLDARAARLLPVSVSPRPQEPHRSARIPLAAEELRERARGGGLARGPPRRLSFGPLPETPSGFRERLCRRGLRRGRLEGAENDGVLQARRSRRRRNRSQRARGC